MELKKKEILKVNKSPNIISFACFMKADHL